MNARLILLSFSLFICSTLHAQVDSFDKEFKEHFGNLEVATFSMNGKLFATGGWDNMINVYSGDSQELVSSLYGHGGAITSISISRDNKMILSGGKDRKVNLWRWDEENGTFELDSLIAIHSQPIVSVIIGPGMRTLFTASADGEILVHNLRTKKHKRIKHEGQINTIAISNDRQKIFCADKSSNVTVYNPFGKVITTYEGHADEVNSIVSTRNNRFVITGSSDKTVKVWDQIKGKEVRTLEGHGWKVRSVDVSFDGKYMVSGSIDGLCILWDMETGESIKKYNVSNGQVRAVAISPNKEYIVAGIAFDNMPEFSETGGVIWKTGFVAPKKKSRSKSKAARKTASAKTKTTASKKSKEAPKNVIRKDEQVEISIE